MYTHDSELNTSGHTWILVANSSEAKLYTAPRKELQATSPNPPALELIETFTHPQSRKKDSELVSDNSGRYANKGLPTSTFDEASDPHTREQDQFAHELARFLDEKRESNGLNSLILICPARFYGDLNKHLSKQTTHLIYHVIEKDYTKAPEHELSAHIKNTLSLR